MKQYYEAFAGSRPETSKRVIIHAENHIDAKLHLEKSNAWAHCRPEPLPDYGVLHFLRRGTEFCEVPAKI